MSASASSCNTSNSSSESGPSRKKPRHTESKWQANWSKYHLKPSKKGATFVNCTVCNRFFLLLVAEYTKSNATVTALSTHS